MALNHYLIGNSVVMLGSCALVDPLTGDETPTSPALVTFIRVQADGTLSTYVTGDPEVVTLADGIDACTVVMDQSGLEKWRYIGAGLCDGAAEDIFEVDPSSVV